MEKACASRHNEEIYGFEVKNIITNVCHAYYSIYSKLLRRFALLTVIQWTILRFCSGNYEHGKMTINNLINRYFFVHSF